MSIWLIMVFPVLFAVGMALIDTTDGVLMLGAYNWAFVRPARKLQYNLVITAVSVAEPNDIGIAERGRRLRRERTGTSSRTQSRRR
jgi:high-affinity nickel-transport protein